MRQVNKALDEVKDLYTKFAGAPVPELQPAYFVPFPPGVDPVDHAIEEVNRLKEVAEQVAAAPAPVAWIPRADTFATAESWLVRLEIPGVEREDVKVFVDGAECVVRGERKLPDEKSGLRPLGIERPWGAFERRFLLPAGARGEKVLARCLNGELELKLDMESDGLPRRTEVEVG